MKNVHLGIHHQFIKYTRKKCPWCHWTGLCQTGKPNNNKHFTINELTVCIKVSYCLCFYSISIISICFILQVYIHNEALIQSTRHNVVDGFLEMTDRFEDPVNISSMLITVKDERTCTCMTKASESISNHNLSLVWLSLYYFLLTCMCYDLFCCVVLFSVLLCSFLQIIKDMWTFIKELGEELQNSYGSSPVQTEKVRWEP